MKKNIRKYKGIGFVEALIGLTVSGIVGIVLMSISADAIYELRRLDIQDALAQYAVSTSVEIQKMALNDPNFINDHPSTKCYFFEGGDLTTKNGQNGAYETGERPDGYEQYLILDEDQNPTEYFRAVCLPKSSSDSKKLIVEIIVGSVNVDGKVTSDRDIKDYRHISVINL